MQESFPIFKNRDQNGEALLYIVLMTRFVKCIIVLFLENINIEVILQKKTKIILTLVYTFLYNKYIRAIFGGVLFG